MTRRADRGLSREQAARRREELAARARVLRAEGKTWAEIGAELGASRSAIRYMVGPDDPAPKPPASPQRSLAEQAVEMHDAGASPWSIARELGCRTQEVERAIGVARLEEQVASGRLRIRFATGEELERLRRDRAQHDRRALIERDREAA